IPILIVVLAVLVGLSAFFGASETAFTTMNRIRMKNYAKDGNKKAEKALKISEDYDKLITTLLIGNNFVNITAATVSTILFVSFLLKGDEGLAAAVSTVVITLIILTFGEITPKCIAKEKAEKLAMSFAGVLSVLIKVFYPMSVLFLKLKKLMTRSMPEEEAPTMTEEELIVMIEEIEEEGTLEKRESDLIKSAVEFDDKMVGEMCTPRVDVTAIDVTADRDAIKKAFRDTGFSRIPVYRGNIDQIIGVIYGKDFYNRFVDSAKMKVEDAMRPVKFVPESMKISVLLKDLQRSKMHMAVVIDEFGGTVGIVTLEDIIEELIGEIWDESDEVEHDLTENPDGSYIALGGANINDVMEGAEIKFDLGDYEGHTIGGFLLHKFGRIPAVNDTIELENARITVRSVKKRRIREVMITKVERPPEEDGSE
ncbi:MAG: hemolysin family protein, partial [Methanomassiliicoccaceae archaeon]|nr:hemolysin family protein [Methanomassiliicoccaceae archaeon]